MSQVTKHVSFAAPKVSSTPTERTPTVDHGYFASSWSPDDGGTLHTTSDSPSHRPFLIGSGLGLATSLGTMVAGVKLGSSARAAAIASGSTAGEAARIATSVSAKWMLGGTMAAFGLAMGGAVLSDRLRTTRTQEQQMSWSEYQHRDLDDAGRQEAGPSFTRTIGSYAAGVAAAGAGALVAGRLVAGVPTPLRLVGTLVGSVSAGIAGMFVSDQALRRIGV